MPDLAVSAGFGRAELGLADLFVEDPVNGCQVVEYGLGALSWRRQVASSPFLPDVLTAAVKETRRQNLVVRVTGPTAISLNTRVQALLRAVEQFSYFMTVTLNGVQIQYLADPADYVVGSSEALDKHGLMIHQQTVQLLIPTTPIPTLGGI